MPAGKQKSINISPLVRPPVVLFFLAGLLIANIFLAGCAVNPVTGQSEYILVTEDMETNLGKEADKEIKDEYGVYEDAKLSAYVDRVGQKIGLASHRPNLKYYFTVLDTPIINAFALPGGYVYITRGLLAYLNSEAELASVLGHETGHIAAKHGAKALSTSLTYQILSLGASYVIKGENVDQIRQAVGVVVSLGILGYGRENEFQADQLGTDYAAKIGYSPEATVSFLNTIKRLEGEGDSFFLSQILASHPPTKDRIKKAQAEGQKIEIEMTKAEPPVKTKSWLVGADDYKKKIDGLLWGFSLGQGTLEGQTYKNNIYHCGLIAPKDWTISNADRSFLATMTGPDQDRQFMLQGRVVGSGTTPLSLASEVEKKFALTKKQEKSGWFNGYSDYLAYYEGKVNDQNLAAYRLYWIYKGKGYIFSLLTTQSKAAEVIDDFQKIVESFWILSADEEASIKERHIKIYTVKAGDNWQDLAKKYKIDPAKKLAELNGCDLTQFPELGTLVKLLPQ